MSLMRSVAAAAVLLGGTLAPAFAQDAIPVRLGWLKASLSTITQAIAESEGLYAQNGLAATITPISSGGNAAGIESLMRGDFDVYYGPMTEMARLNGVAFEQKMETPIIAVALGTPGATHLVLAKGQDYKSLADLQGKTIGVSSPGSVHLVMFRHYLQAQGLSTEALDLKIVKVGGSDMVPALTTQQIDGFLHSQPNPAIAEVRDVGHVALAPADMGEAGQSPTSAVMVRRDWAEANPEAIKRVVATFLAASEQYQNVGEERLIAIASEAIGAEPEVIKSAIPYVNPRMMPDYDKAVELYWSTEIAAMKERGELDQGFAKEHMFDGSFMPAN